MKIKETPAPAYDVGIIIGRFQVPDLHEAHLELIQSVVNRHPKVIMFLGLSPAKTTYNNPLDFEARKQMILDKFPNINILYIKDQKQDDVWSKNLDAQISDLIGPNQTVVLYGGRDSFIPHYTGRFPTLELEPKRVASGKEIRKEVGKATKGSVDFRRGVIWAVENQFPSFYPTCDVAIIDRVENRILLGRKSGEKEYRFPGGFADPLKDKTMEQTVRRETYEECPGIEISDPEYIGSQIIDDWRYRSERNKIMTFFYYVTVVYGSPGAGDDLAEVRWFGLDEIDKVEMVENHKVLREMLKKYLNKNTTFLSKTT
jgi:bifunctional NMN adenylyltransferase/nudix hydrolase